MFDSRWTTTLGARAAVSGYNRFENTWGGSAVNIKGIEAVLANGNVVQLGRGSRVPAKNVTGFALMSLFLGSMECGPLRALKKLSGETSCQ